MLGGLHFDPVFQLSTFDKAQLTEMKLTVACRAKGGCIDESIVTTFTKRSNVVNFEIGAVIISLKQL